MCYKNCSENMLLRNTKCSLHFHLYNNIKKDEFNMYVLVYVMKLGRAVYVFYKDGMREIYTFQEFFILPYPNIQKT